MSDEPIPLWDGEPLGGQIRHEGYSSASGTTGVVRSRRESTRAKCEQIRLCFSPSLPSGLEEHVECPVFDRSVHGFAIEYDSPLEIGTCGYVAYATVGHQVIRVSCTVRRCAPMENGHYLLGIKLDRKLNFEERRLARWTPGRDVVPGIRPRKLRRAANAKQDAGPGDSHAGL